MSKRQSEKTGEPVWKSIRFGFCIILIGGLVVTLGQLVVGASPSWNSTGPAFITVGALGVIGSYIVSARERRNH